MIIYIKLGRVRGVSIDLKYDLGCKPFFSKKNFHHETIIDIPYAQIAYTSGKWFPSQAKLGKLKRSVSNGNKQNGKTSKSSQRADKR